MKRYLLPFLLFLVSTVWVGCLGLDGGDSSTRDIVDNSECSIPKNQIFNGGPGKDGIPALTNPNLISASEVTYLADDNRVIGIFVDGAWIAVPHNILWHHEIINFDFSQHKLAVTYCPLTGSSIVFDRASVGGAEFGVSGLLYQTNLILYDRNKNESLFSQMSRQGSCGPRLGTQLATFPAVEMTWKGWRELYPDSRVVSQATGHSRAYGSFPYGGYEALDSGLIFPVSFTDERRPPKERVLGFPDGDDGGIAFPFLELDQQPLRAVPFTYKNRPVVVFWNRAREAAAAFYTDGNVPVAEFAVREEQIVDTETGSVWTVAGEAVDGPRAGARLEPVVEAYVAFWFAWGVFQGDTTIWTD